MSSLERQERPLAADPIGDHPLTPTQEFANLSLILAARVRATDLAEQQRVKSQSLRGLRLAARLGIDAVLLNVAFALAYWARYNAELLRDVAPEFRQPLEAFATAQLLFTVLGIIVFYSRGVYAQPRGTGLFDQMTRIAGSTLLAIGLLLLGYLIVSPTVPSRLLFVFLWVAVLAVFTAERFALRRVRLVLWRRGINEYRVIVVGATPA